MSEHDKEFAPTDPSVEDDLLAPESHERAQTGESWQTDKSADTEESGEAEIHDEARPARDPSRQLVRIGWAAVAVLAVIGVLMVVELVRLSNAVSNNTCVQKAQANFVEALGRGVSPQFAGLDRLTGQNQLKKCGQ